MKNTSKKRLISVLLTLSVLSGSSLFAFAQDETANVDEIISANDLVIDSSDNAIPDELTTEEDDDYTPRYVEDEVIIMLADTPETENLQLYSVYSDDYQTLNREATEKAVASRSTYALNSATETVTVAGSTNAIEDILDLGIEITEMKMLNPQSEAERVNTVSASRSAIATNTNEKVYTVNEENNSMFSIKFEDASVGEVIAMLDDNPMIEVAEPNYIYESLDASDIYVNEEQYGLNAIHAPWVWYTTTGSPNVSVGIMDTGMDGTHPDLVNNLWVNPYYTEDDGCSVCSRTDDIHGYNFTGYGTTEQIPCGGIPTDVKGHGTHVAGIVGARSSNATNGVSGVCPYVSLVWLGCWSLNGSGASISGAIQAVNYADTHGIDILNCSFGGHPYSRILERAISNYDGLVVAGAANNGGDNDILPIYPASYECPNIISVAASNSGNLLWANSNYGANSVDVVAPGADIYSTLPGGSYGDKSGTSMASPHVAGVAALLKSFRPSYTPQMIKAAICHTVQDLGKEYNVIYDGGIVDAYSALNAHPGVLKSVTFDYNYSTIKAPFVDYVVTGNKVRIPEIDPEREDYIFKGWYTAASGGQQFDFETTISSNITIYAQWEEVEPDSFGEKFPDKIFRNYVLDFLNSKDQGNRVASTEITDSDIEELADETILDISDKGIRDFSGIEYFTGLKTLYCYDNKALSADLKELSNLEYLDISFNGLISLNLSGSSNLKSLHCQGNSITSMNLSHTPNLEYLNCSGNILSAINVSSVPNLQHLCCTNLNLSALDITNLSNLTYLDCQFNNLSSLNLNFTTKLIYLYCNNNCLSSLDFSNTPNLKTASCSNNNITSLNFATSSALEKLFCSNNQLSSLNVLTLKSLKRLECSNNNITNLNVSHLSNLTKLICNNNQMTVLNAACSGLTVLDCRNNELIQLKVVGCEDLSELKCYNNHLTVLNLYGLSNLEYVDACGNDFNTITDIICNDNSNILNEAVYFGNQNPWTNNCFTDVLNNIKAVQYVYENSLMAGTSSTVFSPYQTLTRIEFAEILYNMAGTPVIESVTNPFTDLDTVTYSDSYNAVMWVYSNGFIESDTSTTYNPEGAVTRETAALALYRYADEYDIPLTDFREYSAFADESSISSNALTAVQEMYKARLMNPSSVNEETGAITFSPNAILTRIEAAVLIRLFEVYRLYL